jgi:hypothetical protein
VPQQRWRRERGTHEGLIVRVTDVNALSVQYRIDRPGKNMGGSFRKWAEKDQRMPRTMFIDMHTPASPRDLRLAVPPLTPTPLVVQIPEPTPTPMEETTVPTDTDRDGETITVPYAHKRCARCGEDKALGLFGRSRSSKDGLQSYCTACTRVANKQNYLKRQAIKQQPTPPVPAGAQVLADEAPLFASETPLADIFEEKFIQAARSQPIAPGRTWKVRARVFEEREIMVEATNFREAAVKAEVSVAAALDFEIVSVSLEG